MSQKSSLFLCHSAGLRSAWGRCLSFTHNSVVVIAELLLMPISTSRCVGVLFWKFIATQLRLTMRGFLLFPSDIFSSPLTNLSILGYPSRTGAPRIAFLLLWWTYACMHLVAPSSPSPFGYKVQYAFHFWLEFRAVTNIDIHLRLASNISSRSSSYLKFFESLLYIKNFNVFSENSVQLSFHFVAFILGFVEVVLHFFDQISCFILLVPSFSKFSKQVSDHSSFFSCFSSMTAASTILYNSCYLFVVPCN